MVIRDKYGYPIEIYKGRHVHNFFRKLFLCNLKQTYINRKEINKWQKMKC